MAICRADKDHCCNLGEHGVCKLLRDDGPDAARRWVCTIRERVESWDAVHADPVYLRDVHPIMIELTGVNCGDWPPPGTPCYECNTHTMVEVT